MEFFKQRLSGLKLPEHEFQTLGNNHLFRFPEDLHPDYLMKLKEIADETEREHDVSVALAIVIPDDSEAAALNTNAKVDKHQFVTVSFSLKPHPAHSPPKGMKFV